MNADHDCSLAKSDSDFLVPRRRGRPRKLDNIGRKKKTLVAAIAQDSGMPEILVVTSVREN